MRSRTPTSLVPNILPADWRDDSLCRAALRLNCDKDVPAMFPDDSLAYLSDLSLTLPRRGIVFLAAATGFIWDLAISSLPESQAAMVRHVQDLQQRKENAVAKEDFETARTLRHQQDELRAALSKCRVHEITRDEIRNGLLRVGVDPDRRATVRMNSM